MNQTVTREQLVKNLFEAAQILFAAGVLWLGENGDVIVEQLSKRKVFARLTIDLNDRLVVVGEVVRRDASAEPVQIFHIVGG